MTTESDDDRDPFQAVGDMENDVLSVRDFAWAIEFMAGTTEDQVLGQAIARVAEEIRSRCEAIELARGVVWHALNPSAPLDEAAKPRPGLAIVKT